MAHRIANSFLRGLLADSLAEQPHSRKSRASKRRSEVASNSNSTLAVKQSQNSSAQLPSLNITTELGNQTRRQRGNLHKLLAEADVALQRVREELKLIEQDGASDGEELLQDVNTEFAKTMKTVGSQDQKKKVHTKRKSVLGKAVNPADYTLTKERVEAVAQDGLVMVTWANYHYLDFAKSWLAHLHQLNISCYLLGTLDNQLLQALVDASEEKVFAMQTGLDETDLMWGSSQFFKMGREKISLILTITSMGFDILVSDIDTAWVKSPIPYMARYPDADVLVSSDHLSNTTNDDGLELFPEASNAFNIGIILMRESALPLAQEWENVLRNDSEYWDQHAFNDLLRRGLETHIDFLTPRQDRLFKGYDGKLLAGVLPVALFASGHTFYVQDIAGMMGLDPYVVHNTFQFSGTPGKRHRFRDKHMWLADEAEYYDPPGGLLSLDVDVKSYLEPASHLDANRKEDPIRLDSFVPHFQLVNTQLRQVRHAMVLCAILGRTLLLPEVVVGADRWWAPHLGITPGAIHMKVPAHVPADHIFDLDVWSRQGDSDYKIPFREHNMLSNPKSPASLRESRLEVNICEQDSKGCVSDPSQLSGKEKSLQLAPNLRQKEIVAIFQVFKEVKTIHFTNLTTSVGFFDRKEDARRFENQIKTYASLWCCAHGSPGHVWYDFFWDIPGHRDRHNRLTEEWEPVMGP